MKPKDYLNRIHLKGPIKPNLKSLQLLQKAHLLHIPFENLDIHYGTRIELDPGKIYHKIIHNNRGGFCYELNGIFSELLTTLGFQCKRISARVYEQEKGYGAEFDHMAIIVKIGAIEYLTDVGFGEFTFAPLAVELNEIQKDERGDFIFHEYDGQYTRVGEMVEATLNPQYIFRTVAQDYSVFKERCHYHQTSPKSHFTQKKLISKATKEGRITITGDTLKIKKGTDVKELLLKGSHAFDIALWKYFNIKMEEG